MLYEVITILLSAGWKRSRALFWNIVSSLTAIIGGIGGYYALDRNNFV